MTMDPGLILAIVSLTIVVLEKIVNTANEARQFKTECQELGAISASLKLAIENNRGALTNHESCVQLQSCVADVEVFVTECAQRRWNVLKQAREVFFSHRAPHLKQRLFEWMNVFVSEGSVSGTALRCWHDG
jgi:hypothetical protein